MSGKSVLTDTNIVIYLLRGDRTAAQLLFEKEIAISFITEIELISSKSLNSKEKALIEQFLADCKIIQSNSDINRKAAELRRTFNLELPDAIIVATSVLENIPLITADRELMKVDQVQIIKYSPGSSLP